MSVFTSARSMAVRLTTAVLAAAALVSLAGCGGSPGADDAPEPGTYTVDVALTGGTGRVTVESPATVVVTADAITATVVWSSTSLTWMQIDDTQYTPTSATGDPAVFEIPVVLDTDMAVTAETVAMGDPHEIDYTLRFDSSTLKAA